MKASISISFSYQEDLELLGQRLGKNVQRYTTRTVDFDVDSATFDAIVDISPNFEGPFRVFGEVSLSKKELGEIEAFRVFSRKNHVFSDKQFLKMQEWIESLPTDEMGGREIHALRWLSKKRETEKVQGLEPFELNIANPALFGELYGLTDGNIGQRPVVDWDSGEEIANIVLLTAPLLSEKSITDPSTRNEKEGGGWRDTMTLAQNCIDKIPMIGKSLDTVDQWGQRCFIANRRFYERLKKSAQKTQWGSMPIHTKESSLYQSYLNYWERIAELANRHPEGKLS